MKAQQSHALIRLVSPLMLLGILAASLWVTSLPAQAVSTASTSKPPSYVARLRPLLLANMQQLRIPGVMVYGKTKDDAVKKVYVLALRVLADQMESSEASSAPQEFTVSLACSR